MISEKSWCGLRPNVFNKVILDHADWSRSAAGEAFNKFDAVFAILTERDGAWQFFMIIVSHDPGGSAGLLHQRITACHRTTQGSTNPNVFFTRRSLPEHGIKGDQLKDVDRLEFKLCRDPFHPVIADESEFLLPQM